MELSEDKVPEWWTIKIPSSLSSVESKVFQCYHNEEVGKSNDCVTQKSYKRFTEKLFCLWN